jgi:hypothetical protein
VERHCRNRRPQFRKRSLYLTSNGRLACTVNGVTRGAVALSQTGRSAFGPYRTRPWEPIAVVSQPLGSW